jgi:hypothetical protein
MATSGQIATAYHEASHAVTAIELGIGLRKRGISIERDKDSLGQCYTRKPFRGCSESEGTDMQRVRAEKHAIICLAGYTGQRRFFPRSRDGGAKDRRDAASLMCHFVGSERELDAYMKLLQIHTEQLLSMEHIQSQIEDVAKALIERKRLSAAEVEAIVWSV